MKLARKVDLFIGFLIVVSLVLLAAPSWATGGGHGECDHPRFLERGCGYEGEDGEDGRDGRDGVDGRDGIDGMDGRDGIDGMDGDSAYQVAVNNGFEGSESDWLASLVGPAGRDGVDGKDGEVPTEWITEVRNNQKTVNNWYQAARDAAAASAAMQVHLPQYQQSRLTFSGSRVNGRTGIGIGYAYMLDKENNAGVTLAIGRAGDETAIRGSFGFEFGGDRPMRLDLSSLMPAAAPEPMAAAAPPPPDDAVVIPEDEYHALLLAQVQAEEFEEQRKMIEDRFAQYDNLIQAQQAEIDAHAQEADEIEELKREQAELKAAEEAHAQRRAEVRERLLEKGKEDGLESANQ